MTDRVFRKSLQQNLLKLVTDFVAMLDGSTVPVNTCFVILKSLIQVIIIHTS